MKKEENKKQIISFRPFLGQKIGKTLGNHKSDIHPTTSTFLLGNRGVQQKISLIDYNFTVKYITKSLYVIISIIKKKGNILFVNTNPENSNILNQFAKKISNLDHNHIFSFSNTKWVGGTLTNWKKISSIIAAFKNLKYMESRIRSKMRSNFRKKMVSKKKDLHYSEGFSTEQARLKSVQKLGGPSSMVTARMVKTEHGYTGNDPATLFYFIRFPKYKKLKKSFQGFKNPQHIPSLLFVVNPNDNYFALNEAKRLNIPVIALSDTNTDLTLITYPIPVNINSLFFLQYYFSWIIRILKYKGKKFC